MIFFTTPMPNKALHRDAVWPWGLMVLFSFMFPLFCATVYPARVSFFR
jgi:hypothetical protein